MPPLADPCTHCVHVVSSLQHQSDDRMKVITIQQLLKGKLKSEISFVGPSAHIQWLLKVFRPLHFLYTLFCCVLTFKLIRLPFVSINLNSTRN